MAAVTASPDVEAVYFGGTTDATTVISGNILIIGGGGNFHNGVDGTPAQPEEAVNVTIDEANRIVQLRIMTTDTLGAVKAVVDAVDGLGSEYFGGRGATDLAGRVLPWTEQFTLVTVVGGPAGPPGSLSAADRQTITDARDQAVAARN